MVKQTNGVAKKLIKGEMILSQIFSMREERNAARIIGITEEP